jgi:hypothetical protein
VKAENAFLKRRLHERDRDAATLKRRLGEALGQTMADKAAVEGPDLGERMAELEQQLFEAQEALRDRDEQLQAVRTLNQRLLKEQKGSSWDHVEALMRDVDEGFVERCIASGMSSGEGLIAEVADNDEQQSSAGERRKAHTVRLALIYALPDCSDVISLEHLEAALAFWAYSAASARWVFGDSIGDPTADEIWSLARERHDGITRTEVSNLFSRNKKAREIDRALQALIDAGRLQRATVRDPRNGRTLTVWRPAGEPASSGAEAKCRFQGEVSLPLTES